jgi:hypothetical protein
LDALSLRKRMESHRSNPTCASCHKIMDPIGFSLRTSTPSEMENARWSQYDRCLGELVDGTKVTARQLADGLMHYSDQFVRTMTERLLTYSLGRGLNTGHAVVRSIVRRRLRKLQVFIVDPRNCRESTVPNENEIAIKRGTT